MCAALRETLNVVAPDELYELLIKVHEGLTEAECLKLDAKLIILLSNHIGDIDVIRGAIAKAKERS